MKAQIQLDLNAVMEGIAKLDLDELEAFATKINYLVAKKKAPNIPKREAILLEKINEGLPIEIQEEYHTLLEKSANETLTESEHKRLLKLIPLAEAKQVERLKYLIELAQLRNITVDELMEHLGITPPANVQKTRLKG